MLRKWGKITEDNITNKLNKEKVCNTTYNRRLRILKNFSKWLTNRKIWTNSYLDEVTTKKVIKSTEPKRAPFTNEEISSVLRAFKNDTFTPNKSAFKHSHYYPFIYFLFKTGVRNAEAIGLRVSSINLETNQICINEGNLTLTGGLPGGGTYSGTGVTVSPTFNPATAGAGDHFSEITNRAGEIATGTQRPAALAQ